jgi:hypothetical protein
MQPSRRHIRPLRRLSLVVLGALALLYLTGCEEPAVNRYSAQRDKPEPDTTRLASYTLPKGWTRLKEPKEFSVASFEVTSGKDTALITVSRLPGKAGGLKANIDRWRGKVGLKDDQPANQDPHWLVIDEVKTPYVDFEGPGDQKGSGPTRLLGVVAERGPVTWFFKMQGPPGLVKDQKTAFEAFVTSVKFGGPGGYDE